MTKGRGPWQDGGRAWKRLNGWHQDGPAQTPGHPDDGDVALAALVDVGLIRHLLDQAELVAVRTARRHGKSWAEIATKLGVTRQSAWERWRDLDETPHPSDSSSHPDAEVTVPLPPDVTRSVMPGVTPAVIPADDPGFAPGEVLSRAAREARRRPATIVPDVIGRSVEAARTVLQETGLAIIWLDADGPTTALVEGWADGMVTDQSPESGAKVPTGTSVTLWVKRGGGSAGVREPRRPKPDPKAAREMRPEVSDEAVG